ncbi:uncharacterized protein LOC133798542 [Humulus lupulus]|uniref:uncharacterized protein LOC133798542 n=1 Tax=Humulus lupulus TaxID=3486 RepID=UPI002B4094EC|nr:uncharacterized protein LOC133798542 [Humulus lupulus]XP_062092862.1 uncharacterized protein LOC133798542 [Humulus lupulus]
MDVTKDRGVPVGSVSESTVTESEHVAGETLVGTGDDAVQGKIEGSFNDGVEDESCHGNDIMVEVLGSDVYVGGVCTSESGENLDDGNDDAVPLDAEVVSERPVNPIGIDGGSAVDGSDSRDAGVSGGELLNQGNGGSLGVSESVEEKAQHVDGMTREASSGEMVTEDTRRGSQIVSGGNCAGGTEVVGSTGGEIQVNHVAMISMVPREEGVEGVIHEVGANNDGEVVSGGCEANEVVSKQGVEVPEENSQDAGKKSEVLFPSVSSECCKFQVVVVESIESGSRLAMEVVGGGDDAPNDLKTQNEVGVSDEAWNPGIETIETSAENVVSCSAETQVHEEKSVITVYKKDLNPKISLGQSNDAGAEEFGGVDKRVLLSSKDAVPETNANSENFSSVEKEQLKIVITGGSTEKHSNLISESESSLQQTQVIVESEVSVIDSKVISVSQKDEILNPEGYYDNSMACDIHVESNVEQAMEIDRQVKDGDQVYSDGGHEKVLIFNTEVLGAVEYLKSTENSEKSEICDVSPICVSTVQEIETEHGGQQIQFENQQEMSRKMSGVLENDGHAWADVTFSCEPSELIHVEDTTAGDTAPNPADKAVLPPSGNDRNSQIETLWCSEMDNQTTDNVDIAPMDTNEVLGQSDNNEECLQEGVATDCSVSKRNFAVEEGVKEQVTSADEFGLHGEKDLVVVKEITDSEQTNTSKGKSTKVESSEPENSLVNHHSCDLPPEDEDVFSVTDLVWGKVKSHPWWPGQIFDFTDASEKAMKHHKKDCFLVAYFGDRTFAWNEALSLKPFRSHFSQMEKQGNADTFQNAVNCALGEISRRVQLGLACSCIPKDSHNIQFQIVENAGIRTESSRRGGVDDSASVNSLQSDKLLEYLKALAQSPLGGNDRLELVIAKAQLLAFCRLKGFCSLPEFQCCGGLVENNTIGSRFQDSLHPNEMIEDASSLSKDDERTSSCQDRLKLHSSSHKRKHNLRDGVYPKLKEKSLSELMVGVIDFPDDDNWSGKRRRGVDYHAEDLAAQDLKKTVSVAKASNSIFPKQSFKIGECIRRVASQMTASQTTPSPPTVKLERVKLDGSSDRPGDGYEISFQSSEDVCRGRAADPAEYSSLDELLSQLQSVAQDPLKEYNLSSVIISFFTDFRNSVITGQYSGTELVLIDKVTGKRKKGSPETFEFDDMNDTYWTDRVIQNGSEEQPPRRGRKKDNQPAVTQPEKPHQESRRTYSRKRYSNGDAALTPEKPAGYVSENAPAELIMNFSEVRSMPSESNLNKMFRRFGPLKEMETEVDRESSRARVVFKKSSDAEVACSSAEKFHIFGSTLVNYQLSYTPTLPCKASPVVVTTQDHEMQLDLSAHDHEMQLDLSTHEHEMQLDLSTHDHEMQLDLSSLSSFEVNLV